MTMKRDKKKPMLLFLSPVLKEMIRYQAYKEHKSQNLLIENILESYLGKKLANDNHYKDLAKI